MAALMQKQMAGLKAAPVARTGINRLSAVSVNARLAAKPKAATYVCLECGYVYDGKVPFTELKSYACPVCAAPKRRFKEAKGNVPKGNDRKSMSERREKIRAQVEAEGGNPDEGGNELLIVSGLTAAAAIAFLVYTNL